MVEYVNVKPSMIFTRFLGQSNGYRINNNALRDKEEKHSFDKFFEYRCGMSSSSVA